VKNRPRFFCEHCGAEVPRDAKNCPRCGRYFLSVKCPACGFVGAEGLFGDGCPVCGYSDPGRGGGGKTPPGREAAGALPLWVYAVTLTAFLAVLGVLYLTVF
jgi:hypothetical protein